MALASQETTRARAMMQHSCSCMLLRMISQYSSRVPRYLRYDLKNSKIKWLKCLTLRLIE